MRFHKKKALLIFMPDYIYVYLARQKLFRTYIEGFLYTTASRAEK